MARRLGVDYGEKRMGIAVCDPQEWVATPLCVVPIHSEDHALQEIRRLIAETGAEAIVLGLPLNMDNTRGPMAQRVEAFAERLRREIGVPVDLWDERLSSAEVERILLEGDASRARRRAVTDMLAAQTVLQSYIDARHPSR